MTTQWLENTRSTDLETVGGKGASLGELTDAGLPVPPGFVVTAETYRTFLETAGIETKLFEEILAVDADDSAGLAAAAAEARDLIRDTPLPETVREDILTAYRELGEQSDSETNGQGSEPFVAVRSSATAEDLPDASFAGQHETFLNVTEEDLVERVKACWASLFSERAVHYRNNNGFDHASVDIAVVVQQMVDAEKSGVMFTCHPSTGDRQMIIESAWGLGEAVVSGAVSPDHYVIDPDTAEIVESTIADKKQQMIKDPETGETALQPVDAERRTARVVTDEEIEQLIELGRLVEDHYGEPQDVEWAIVDGEVFMLQSRPITTIDTGPEREGVSETADAPTVDGGLSSDEQQAAALEESTEEADEVLVRGVSASPGKGSGEVRIIKKLDHLDQVTDGDIIVSKMTMPDMVPAMKRAAAIITDEGGMTSHASIVSREMGVPAVVGTRDATQVLTDGQLVTVDGDMGVVREGGPAEEDDESAIQPDPVESVRPQTPVKPMTATEVKVNLSIPEAAERAEATGADGVGLLRIEHMVISLGKTPEQYIEDHGEDAYISELVDGIRTVAEEF